MQAHRIAAAAALLGGAALVAQAATVNAPPKPDAGPVIRIEPGMNPVERKRAERAHSHKMRRGKDALRDDSDDAVNPAERKDAGGKR